jgi:dynein heavy chain
MKSSLKDLCKKSLQAYPNTVRTEWAKMWPGQIVLAGSQIFWTTEVEKAISNGELDAYYKVQQS